MVLLRGIRTLPAEADAVAGLSESGGATFAQPGTHGDCFSPTTGFQWSSRGWDDTGFGESGDIGGHVESCPIVSSTECQNQGSIRGHPVVSESELMTNSNLSGEAGTLISADCR